MRAAHRRGNDDGGCGGMFSAVRGTRTIFIGNFFLIPVAPNVRYSHEVSILARKYIFWKKLSIANFRKMKDLFLSLGRMMKTGP
jgi:hypothetical protein